MLWVVIVVFVAEEGRKEGLRDCSLNICEFHGDIFLDPLNKLPFLLE
jgi:hypothetical protein